MVRRLPLLLCAAALLVARASRATPQVSGEISLDSPLPSTVPSQAYYEAGAQGAGVSLLTWLDYRDRSGDTSLYAARVSADGTILDPGGILLAGHTAGGSAANVAVVFDGTLFLVTWSDWRADAIGADLYAARITADGRDLEPGGRQLIARPDDQLGPALASNGSQLLVTWTDSRTDASKNIHSSVWAQRVDPATLATVGPAVSVSATPDNTNGAHAAWNGVSWIVAFASWPVASYEPADVGLEIVRINAAGALLDARPHLISASLICDRLASSGRTCTRATRRARR